MRCFGPDVFTMLQWHWKNKRVPQCVCVMRPHWLQPDKRIKLSTYFKSWKKFRNRIGCCKWENMRLHAAKKQKPEFFCSVFWKPSLRDWRCLSQLNSMRQSLLNRKGMRMERRFYCGRRNCSQVRIRKILRSFLQPNVSIRQNATLIVSQFFPESHQRLTVNGYWHR